MNYENMFECFGKAIVLLLLAIVSVIAENNMCLADVDGFEFRVETNKENATYKCGEEIIFKIQLFEKDTPALGRKLSWIRNGDDGKVANGELLVGKDPGIIATALDKPGFVYIVVTVHGEDGKPVKIGSSDLALHCGAGAEIEKLAGVSEPADFDEFWSRQKEKLSRVPMNIVMEPEEIEDPEVESFDIKVDCAGGKSVSGYYSRPKGTKPKSLPAMVSYHGAGVRSAIKRESWAARGALYLDINAHGIENGKSDEYYKNLSKNELKHYGSINADNPETCYVRGMYLRVLRSLEFMKAQPEWDGKNLFVYGGSQGGAQAIAAAALDQDVTVCSASRPGFCDVGGSANFGRFGGIHRRNSSAARLYFDSANLAKRIKCRTYISAGLGDYVCPPSGICVAYNNLSCEKFLMLLQGVAHWGTPSFPQPGDATESDGMEYMKTIMLK